MADRFPNNPLEAGNFGEEDDSGDVLALLDRMRRNFELMEGGIEQEDASFQDRVTVNNGNKLTVTISPTSKEKWFLFEGIAVDPVLPDVEFAISADGENTDAAKLTSSIPDIVRDQIKVEITNNSGSQKRFTIDSTAREIDKFQRGDN